MKNKIMLVGGSKGGVGKSMVSISLLDYYITKSRPVALIETDTSNPDVYKVYKDALNGKTMLIDLDNQNGWLTLLDAAAGELKEYDIVINTAARNNIGIETHGGTLNDSVYGLDRDLITLWPINRNRDCVLLLQKYISKMTESKIFVFRNRYFGEPEKFEMYNDSGVRKMIDEKWKTFDFPDLADRVTDDIVSKRQNIADAMTTLSFGSRYALDKWRKDCAVIYDAIFEE